MRSPNSKNQQKSQLTKYQVITDYDYGYEGKNGNEFL